MILTIPLILYLYAKQHAHSIVTSIFLTKIVTLQDHKTRKTIGIGHESQVLYYHSSLTSLAASMYANPPALFRRRLGHPNLFEFQKMLIRFSFLSHLKCESHQFGKYTHVPFPSRSSNLVTSLFEHRTYIDVWGLSYSFHFGFLLLCHIY